MTNCPKVSVEARFPPCVTDETKGFSEVGGRGGGRGRGGGGRQQAGGERRGQRGGLAIARRGREERSKNTLAKSQAPCAFQAHSLPKHRVQAYFAVTSE